MTTVVTRFYSSLEKASAAVAELKASGFDAGDVDLVTADSAGSKNGALVAALRKGEVYEGAAKILADRLKKDGGAAVVVRAPYGNAIRANRILDSFGPDKSGVKHESVYLGSRDLPRRSNNVYLPNLITDKLVFSDRLFPRAVIVNARPSAGLIRSAPKANLMSGTFSEKFGLPLLTRSR